MAVSTSITVVPIRQPVGLHGGRKEKLVTIVFTGDHAAGDVPFDADDCNLNEIESVQLARITDGADVVQGVGYDAENEQLMILMADDGLRAAADTLTGVTIVLRVLGF